MNIQSSSNVKRGQRESQKLETRRVIMEAATDLFSAKGFEGVSLSDIADQGHVKVPLIIYHFSDKLSLWKAVVERVYAELMREIATGMIDAHHYRGIEFFRAAIRAQITAIAAQPAFTRILFREGTGASERLSWLVDNHQRPFSEMSIGLIKQAQQDGLFPMMNPYHAKFIITGALTMPIALAAEYKELDGTDVTDPEWIERHVDLCVALLLGDRSGENK